VVFRIEVSWRHFGVIAAEPIRSRAEISNPARVGVLARSGIEIIQEIEHSVISLMY
jgi:hypothetical protein